MRRSYRQQEIIPTAVRTEHPPIARLKIGFDAERLLLSCALAAVLTIFAGLHSARSADRPNILLLVADDQRPDTIAALGNRQIQTPNLDRLVREGTAFTRAISAYPICHVSRAELLTGTTAFRNGVGYRGNQIDASLATWAGTCRAAGYHTWFVGKWHNDGQPKQRGYEETRGLFTSGGATKEATSTYLDHRGQEATGYRGWTFKSNDGKAETEKGVGLTPGISRRFADAAIEFIERKPADPFFLQVSFTAPHDPRLLPPGYEDRYDAAKMRLPNNFAPQHPFDHGNLKGRDEVLLPFPRTPEMIREELAVYYAIISHLDEQIGRMMDALKTTGQLENTLVIFTSDHGLALGSHGLIGKQNLYDHTLGVPLVLRGPGIPKNERRDAQCYLRDLFPTACAVAGINIPETVEGDSLLPIITGRTDSIHPFVIGYFTDTQRAIRTRQWKLIYYPQAKRYQLFDLIHDPDEINDVSGDAAHQSVISSLRRDLFAWLKDNGDPLNAADGVHLPR